MAEFDLVCLANSRKHGGRCVAGWRTDGGGFVRLVSPAPDGTLTPVDIALPESNEPRMFDLIRVGVAGPKPRPNQPENWVIDESPWKLLRRPAPRKTLERLLPLLERGPGILGTTDATIPWKACLETPVVASLSILRPQNPVLRVIDRLGRRRVRLGFSLKGKQYELTVTDPLWESEVALWQEGEYPWWQLFRNVRPPVVTVSLTEPFGDAAECFKVAATVWPGPEARELPPPKPVPPKAFRRQIRPRAMAAAGVKDKIPSAERLAGPPIVKPR